MTDEKKSTPNASATAQCPKCTGTGCRPAASGSHFSFPPCDECGGSGRVEAPAFTAGYATKESIARRREAIMAYDFDSAGPASPTPRCTVCEQVPCFCRGASGLDAQPSAAHTPSKACRPSVLCTNTCRRGTYSCNEDHLSDADVGPTETARSSSPTPEWHLTEKSWTPADSVVATSIAVAMGHEPEDADEVDDANIAHIARAIAQVRRETIEACAQLCDARKASHQKALNGLSDVKAPAVDSDLERYAIGVAESCAVGIRALVTPKGRAGTP